MTSCGGGLASLPMLRRFPRLVVGGVLLLFLSPCDLLAGGGDDGRTCTFAESSSPLHDAVVAKDVDEVRLLLREGVDLEDLNAEGETPLAAAGYAFDANPFMHESSWRKRLDIVRLLVDAGHMWMRLIVKGERCLWRLLEKGIARSFVSAMGVVRCGFWSVGVE